MHASHDAEGEERGMAKWPGVRFEDVHRFVEDLVGEDLHAKRVYSLANATLGAMTSASL